MQAPPAGKDRQDRVLEPVGIGEIADGVAVFDEHAEDVGVIETEIVEGFGVPGDPVIDDAAVVAPEEIGDFVKIAVVAQRFEEQAQRLFGRIATEDIVDIGVVPHELIVIIGRREAADDHRNIWVLFLEQGGEAETAIDMGEPVQVDAEGLCFQTGNKVFRDERGVMEHLQGEVDDADRQAMAGEIFGEGQKADGIALEDRCRGDDITDRPHKTGEIAKAEDAGGVKEDQVGHGHGLLPMLIRRRFDLFF